jgi:Transcription factor WhiB
MGFVRFEINDWDFSGAACREIVDAHVYFFPEKGSSVSTAKMICSVCPVKRECLNYAVQHTEIVHGVWGGMSSREIRRIRATLGIQEEEEDDEATA